MPLPRALILLAITASCGRHEPAAAPSDAAPRREGLRFDRREERIAPVRWGMKGIADVAFCPGDKELVTILKSGWLLRWNVADGTLVNGTSIAAREPNDIAHRVGLAGEWPDPGVGTRVDCGPDGSALGVADLFQKGAGFHGILYRVEPDGTRHPAPASESIEDARFLPDGSIRIAVTPRGLATWNGAALVPLAVPEDSAFAFGHHLGRGGLSVASEAPTPSTVRWNALVADHWVVLPGTDTISAVAQAPDGAIAAIVAGGQVKLWTFDGDKPAKPKRVSRRDISTALVAAGDRYVLVATLDELYKVGRPELKRERVGEPCAPNQGDHIAAIALAHDGHTLAVACTETGVRLIDLDGPFPGRAGDDDFANGSATGIAWSPSGKLAFGSYGHVLVRDDKGGVETIKQAASGQVAWLGDTLAITQRERSPIQTYEGGKWVNAPALTFLPARVAVAGDTVIAVSSTMGKAVVIRGGTTTELPLAMAENLTDEVLALAPDGSRVGLLRGAGTPAQLVQLDVASQKTSELPISASTIAITKDLVVLATPEGRLFRPEAVAPPSASDPWAAAATGTTTVTLGDPKSEVLSLAISRDGVIAAGGADGRITLWQSGNQLGTLDAHVGGGVSAVAWAPDGHHLASAGPDGAIVWDLSP